jgi:NAD(P)-dependent dehydrogenase (short-subunit alcohol dehydrogenase family)
MERVALVTGASRGIGREVARQLMQRGLRVIGTSRTSAPSTHALDVSDAQSIETLARFIEKEVGRLDVLVNNAAILLDEGKSVVDVAAEEFEATWRANVFGAFLLTKRLAALLRASGHGRVVNVSSGAGQLSTMSGYAPSYSISKAALNALTIQFASALRRDHVLVNCADPGWVRTDMGGSAAPRSVEEGADTIVWLATLPDDGPTGGFFHDRKRVAW